MSLIPCSECGAQVSTNAAACPQCGAKPKRPRSTMGTLGILAVVATVGVAVLVIGGRPQESSSGTDKRACAAAIQRAIARSSSRDEAQTIVRADPDARRACAGLEMNGVPVIP